MGLFREIQLLSHFSLFLRGLNLLFELTAVTARLEVLLHLILIFLAESLALFDTLHQAGAQLSLLEALRFEKFHKVVNLALVGNLRVVTLLHTLGKLLFDFVELNDRQLLLFLFFGNGNIHSIGLRLGVTESWRGSLCL